MARTHQYSKAPITEAVIDLRAELAGEFDAESLDSVAVEAVTEYPTKRPIYQAAFQLNFGPDKPSSKETHRQLGIQLMDSEEKQMVQLRVNGFTMSRLNPYQGWHHFQPEARRLWTLYKNKLGVKRVTRIAVRYINRIDLPLSTDDLSLYLTTLPKVDAALSPRMLDQFFMQLQLPQDDLSATAVLTEASTESPPGKTSVLLDIDLFRADSIPEDEEPLWKLFDEFHGRKNQIFEASITEATRRLIDD